MSLRFQSVVAKLWGCKEWIGVGLATEMKKSILQIDSQSVEVPRFGKNVIPCTTNVEKNLIC